MNFTSTYEPLSSVLFVAAAAAFVHMTFQLGVSVLTLLSGHSLGARKSHLRLLYLNWSYILGAFIAVVLLLQGFHSLLAALGDDPALVWLGIALYSFVIGVSICLFYYRRGKGTLLWVPRQMAEYLTTRAKKTKLSVEALALGIMTVVAELPFLLAPLLIIAMLLQGASGELLLTGFTWYAIIASLPLVVITAMVGAGHRISTIQRWREQNKSFLQYSSGLGLIIIGLYLMAFYIFGVPL